MLTVVCKLYPDVASEVKATEFQHGCHTRERETTAMQGVVGTKDLDCNTWASHMCMWYIDHNV